MKVLHIVASILLWVGGINWGLIGLSMLVNGAEGWNVVHWIAGYIGGMPVEGAIYVLVGLSALWLLVTHRQHCKECSA